MTASDAVALAADAVRIGVCRVPQLAAALRHTRAHPNRRPLKLALGDIDAGVQSLLEHRALNRVLRAHRLPTMQLQVPGPGVRRDFVNIEFGVILEVDGTVGHGFVAPIAARSGVSGPSGHLWGGLLPPERQQSTPRSHRAAQTTPPPAAQGPQR
ncbi:hypothetical protein [Nostocoides jenkinsii]|uniref:hypothetical protein n=1 Tax=Nostocoides jenkinsii TaxID=330834 RepID=UPI0012EDE5DB|nr:hypothetical protein [Tetrasphaera jenkinsii]